MAKLTEKQAVLFRGKNWGTVVTLREDGSPHATPVWIDTDGENVVFNTAIGRAKERHLRRDPRVAVTVLPAEDQQSGYGRRLLRAVSYRRQQAGPPISLLMASRAGTRLYQEPGRAIFEHWQIWSRPRWALR